MNYNLSNVSSESSFTKEYMLQKKKASQLDDPNPLLKNYITNKTNHFFSQNQSLHLLPGQYKAFNPYKLEFECINIQNNKQYNKQTLKEYHIQNENNLIYQKFKEKKHSNFCSIFHDSESNNIGSNTSYFKESKNLIFDSNFECGNLFCCYQIADNEYDLILNNDINTTENTNWFMFRVQNNKKTQTVKFKIINMEKQTSLFQKGMKISVYSNQEFKKKSTGWFKDGFNIDYYQNGLFNQQNNKKYHTLQFQYTFRYQDDILYFAYQIPFSYTQLTQHLISSINYEVSSIKTLITNQNEVFKLTLTQKNNNNYELEENKSHQLQNKFGVFIIARQNASDTSSSFITKGITDYLMQNKEFQSQFLLNKCVFKIIPMVNVDGVIVGNSKCDLNGQKINQKWLKNSENTTINSSIKLFKTFKQSYNVQLILDIQSNHKSDNGIIFKGQNNKYTQNDSLVYPIQASQINQFFNIKQYKFQNSKKEKNTAQQYLFDNSFTPQVYQIKASYLYRDQDNKIIEFSPVDFENIGVTLVNSLFQQVYNNQLDLDFSIYKQSHLSKQRPFFQMKQSIIEQLKHQIQIIEDNNYYILDSQSIQSKQDKVLSEHDLNINQQQNTLVQSTSIMSPQQSKQNTFSVLKQIIKSKRTSSLVETSRQQGKPKIKLISGCKLKETTDQNSVFTPQKSTNRQNNLSSYCSIQAEYSIKQFTPKIESFVCQQQNHSHKKQKLNPTPITLYIRSGLDNLKKERDIQFKEIHLTDIKASYRKEQLMKENTQFLVDFDRKIVCNMQMFRKDNILKGIENIKL